MQIRDVFRKIFSKFKNLDFRRKGYKSNKGMRGVAMNNLKRTFTNRPFNSIRGKFSGTWDGLFFYNG